jgi:protocatechuate 3,4-dioxygenase beta subunit
VKDPRLNRRQALAGFGSLSLGAVLAACDTGSSSSTTSSPSAADATGTATASEEYDSAATCGQTAELTEGPYYFDANALRSDIREDRPGATLRLGIRVRSAGDCRPIQDAVVDIWHCDAVGTYSGVQGDSGRFLRGTQPTNAEGIAEFTTVYPGWYQGRTVHIHAKVHLDNQTVLTTQLFFDDEVSTKVYERQPYASHGARDQFNDSDGIFDPSLVMTVREDGDGYRGLMTFDVVKAEA